MHLIELAIKGKIYFGVVIFAYMIVQIYLIDLPELKLHADCGCHSRRPPFINPLKTLHGLEDKSKTLVNDDEKNNSEESRQKDKEKSHNNMHNLSENNENLTSEDIDHSEESEEEWAEMVDIDMSNGKKLNKMNDQISQKPSRDEYEFDLIDLVHVLMQKMLIYEIQRDLPELNQENSNHSIQLQHHVKSVISNFRSNFPSKLAYIMNLKDVIWRDCQLENFILANSQNSHNLEDDYVDATTKLARLSSNDRINSRISSNSIIDFKARLNLFNDFLLGCNIVDFRIK